MVSYFFLFFTFMPNSLDKFWVFFSTEERVERILSLVVFLSMVLMSFSKVLEMETIFSFLSSLIDLSLLLYIMIDSRHGTTMAVILLIFEFISGSTSPLLLRLCIRVLSTFNVDVIELDASLKFTRSCCCAKVEVTIANKNNSVDKVRFIIM